MTPAIAPGRVQRKQLSRSSDIIAHLRLNQRYKNGTKSRGSRSGHLTGRYSEPLYGCAIRVACESAFHRPHFSRRSFIVSFSAPSDKGIIVPSQQTRLTEPHTRPMAPRLRQQLCAVLKRMQNDDHSQDRFSINRPTDRIVKRRCRGNPVRDWYADSIIFSDVP